MIWIDQIWVLREIVRPVLDISILAFLFYRLYVNIAQTRAVQVMRILTYSACVYAFAYIFQLDAIIWLFNHVSSVFIVILAIIYQPELRRAFTHIWAGGSGLFRFGNQTTGEQIDTILNAMGVLSDRRRGALLVFPRKLGIKGVLDSGTRINAELSSALLLTIFDHDTPLHDGAVIIQGGKIVSAGCFLPLSEQSDIRRSFGARHRAALGMAEDTDAVVLSVSEETGAMSLSYNANLYYDLVPKAVKRILLALLNYHDVTPEEVEEAGDEAE